MFISFEGIDGCGKSTQVRLLQAAFQAAGRTMRLVREPGGTAVSERLRALLLDPALSIEPFAELLLFSAARAQLCREVIRPALAAGEVVVADRFYDSTTAYQGGGRGVAEPAWLRTFHPRVTDGLVPARTYLLDLPPDVAAARMRTAGRDADRMEAAGTAFFERVRAAYLDLAATEPERVVVLDATQPVEALHAAIWTDVTIRTRS